MNHISTRSSGGFPPISSELARLVEARTDADTDSRERAARYGQPPTPAMIEEAKASVSGFAAALRPITRDALVAWAEPINAAVRNPQGRQDFLIRISTWMHGLNDVPALCFTLEAQRAALRTFQFWPSAADVYALLAPQSALLHATVNAVRDIARPAPSPAVQERSAATDAERASVAAQLAALKAELRGEECSGTALRSRPTKQLSPELLAHLYAQSGLPNPRTLPHA